MLVEQNRLSEAFDHLREVHGDAIAYYNLGYLLSKKGDTAAAEHHFKQALKIDPTMEPAQRWLSYLQNKSNASRIEGGFKIVHPPVSTEVDQPQEQVATRIMPPPAQPPIQPSVPKNAPQQNPFYPQQRQPSVNRTFTQDSPLPLDTTPPKVNRALSQDPPLPLDTVSPKRLPPVNVRQPIGPAAAGKVSDNSEATPDAPLPP